MAAVMAAAAPLVLLTCAAFFLSSDHHAKDTLADGGTLGPGSNSLAVPGNKNTHEPMDTQGILPRNPAAESVLAEVLRRCDADSTAFLRHRHTVEAFIKETTSHLATLSPLLTNVTSHHDGSAFEGTRTTDGADFDTYALLSRDAVLRHFELQRGADGRIAARLRPGVTRDALPTDLARLVTGDGYLHARRLKRWAFGCLETALRRAARGHARLRPVVYSKHGATGVNLTAADGAILQVDITVQLAPPPTGGVLRPEALHPCGLRLVPPDRAAPWSLYSAADLTRPSVNAATTEAGSATSNTDASSHDSLTDTNTDERWFVVNTMRLERDLLSARPALRSAVRLLKSLSAARRWEERFHVASFILKHAVFWAFAEGCGREEWRPGSGLMPPAAAALRTFEAALRRGWMDKFFEGRPSDNALGSVAGGPPAMLRLAEEVRAAVGTLVWGNYDAVRSLF